MVENQLHLLVYQNNIDGANKFISKNKELIYKPNYNNELPIHISSRLGLEEMTKVFYDIDPTLLTMPNGFGDTPLHFLSNHQAILKYYLNENLKGKKKININIPNGKGITPILSYIVNAKKLDKDIINLFQKNGADINHSNSVSMFDLLNNTSNDKNIINKKITYMMGKFKNMDINRYDNNDKTPLFYSIENNNFELFKTLIEKGADYKAINYDGSMDILTYTIYSHNFKMINYLLNLDLNYSYINSFGDGYLHTAIYAYKSKITSKMIKEAKSSKDKNFKDFDKKILQEIRKSLDKSKSKKLISKLIEKTDLNVQNIERDTPLHLLYNVNILDKFENVLIKNKKLININIKNKKNQKISDIMSSTFGKDYKKRFNIIKTDGDEKSINIMTLGKVTKTSFISRPIDMVIYYLYLIRKYPNLGLPVCKHSKQNKNDEQLNDSRPKKTDSMTMKFNYLTELWKDFNSNNECVTIHWHDNKLKSACENFEKCFKNVKDKQFVASHLSLIGKEISHANIIIIDNNLRTIERFEPYGIINLYHQDDLDKFIENMVVSKVEDITGKKYEWLPPKKFMMSNVFQSMSQEKNEDNINTFEIGGLCLAWCYWYLENRLMNPTVHPKKLVEKLTKKLINNDKISMIEYIRSYSSKLDRERNLLLKEFGFKKHEYYKRKMAPSRTAKLYKQLHQEFVKILLN